MVERARPRHRLAVFVGSLVIVAGLLPQATTPAIAAGSTSLTALDVPYTQDFNTLATTGTSNTTLPNGWDLVESGGGLRDNEQYAADWGSSNTGDTYSFGAAETTERAFGGLQSGTLIPTIGASFTNDTGAVITALDIAYTGEQWRLGAADRGSDRIDFQYSTNATSLTIGLWTDLNTLDFSGPISTGTVGALDGNLAANRTAISGSVPGLAIAEGATFWIRWVDFNIAGADDGLAVDDFSLTPTAGDQAPAVASTTPASGAVDVSVAANVSITFSEPVNVSDPWFSISCTSSGAHTATVTGGPTTFTLNPGTDFTMTETCTVTVLAAQISDQDAVDPPDNPAGDASWSFTTESPPPPVVHVHEIQGASHTSPMLGPVSGVVGIVTAKRSNGYYMQDPNSDADEATSEGIFVFTSSPPTAVNVGDSVRVGGTVTEFRPGGTSSTNLTITEIASPSTTVLSSGNPLPGATVIGADGRVPPDELIEDDAAGSVETSGDFDPVSDGIDFYESLEGMLVQVNDPVVVGPRSSFGEIFVLADDGAGASVRTTRGGIVIRATDFNPERIQLDDAVLAASTPNVNVGDHFSTAAVGVLDYDFGNFEVELTSALTRVAGAIARETTDPAGASELSVATFNVENLDANEPQAKFDALAAMIVGNLQSPDVIALEEIQDNNGATNDTVTDADLTLDKLVDAIATAGGPTYEWRQINPVDDQDGGEPGGNIRVGFMFRTDRGLAFVDRPGGGSLTATTIVSGTNGPELSSSPGRVEPTNTAWNASRKPLAGEFTYAGQTFFLIANHFNSKGGDQPLFGRFQPPTRSSEVQRHQQAQLVNDFVDDILDVDADANIIVLGDINDFEFSETMTILKGGVLHDLMDSLPQAERYSYVFEGNSQVLDHIVVSENLFANVPFEFDPVHANAEFFDQISDHDPSVARFLITVPGTVVVNKTGQGAAALAGAGFTLFVDAAPSGGSRGVEDTTAAGGCTTNGAGTCSITNVPLGPYWLVETTTPNGYATVSPTAVTVGLGPSAGVGDTETVNLADQPVPGTVVVNKTGQGRAKTVGITFTLYVDAAPVGGSRGPEDTTSAGSCVTALVGTRATCSITGVPLGAYWLVETVPAGNAPVSPIPVVVGLGSAPNAGDTDTIAVMNKPKGSPKGS